MFPGHARMGLQVPMKVSKTTCEPTSRRQMVTFSPTSGSHPLTKKTFINRLAKAACDAGEDPLQGHGIRIGSTLEYLLCGIPLETMKVIGRWASDAFTLYLRKHAQILVPYLQASPELHHAFVASTMHLR